MNQVIKACKRDLLDIYQHAVDAVKPERLVWDCIDITHDRLIIRDPIDQRLEPLEYGLDKTRLHVIGGGKCVLGMARGLAELAKVSQTTSLFSHGCLSVPVNLKSIFEENNSTKKILDALDISCQFGSRNNLPDKDSVQATKCLLERISAASKSDLENGFESLFVVLLSGGGSACLTSPKGLNLEHKSRIIENMVERGANIIELNTVRRCFSNVKGGNLARYILANNPKAHIVSLILSDVVGDPIEFIASGPTCLDINGTSQEAISKVFEKYCLEMPGQLIKESSISENVMNRIIGRNQVALNSLANRAQELGYQVISLGNSLTGNTNDILTCILACDNVGPARYLIVCGGESTVCKGPGESWGLGGRVQEMALDYMISQISNYSRSQSGSPSVDLFLAGSTDGQDGPTDVAGCLASQAEWLMNKNFSLTDALQAKKAHDSYNFWTKFQPEWLIKTGPTGTNVMDLYMLLKVSLQ